jgi:flavin reductase (DIM6/NTAB) family NADH-FMN oxidoreductase RutF
MDSAEFRRIMGHWLTGVGVVTTCTGDGRPYGMTANAVASVSLNPMLVLVCVEKDADTHDAIAESKFFCVHTLRDDQERLARRFAAWDIPEKFEGMAYHVEVTGAPVLDHVLSWVDCALWASYPGGDHTIYVGEVVAGDATPGAPLVYYRGGYGRLTP